MLLVVVALVGAGALVEPGDGAACGRKVLAAAGADIEGPLGQLDVQGVQPGADGGDAATIGAVLVSDVLDGVDQV